MGCVHSYGYQSSQTSLLNYYQGNDMKWKLKNQKQYFLQRQHEFQRRFDRRMTCKVITCIQDHDRHYCKICQNKNSDHYSNQCPEKQCPEKQWSPVSIANQSDYFINLRTNANSSFLKKQLSPQKRTSYENTNYSNYSKNYSEFENKNLNQYEKYSHQRVIYQNRNFRQNYNGFNTSKTGRAYNEQLKQKYFR